MNSENIEKTESEKKAAVEVATSEENALNANEKRSFRKKEETEAQKETLAADV